MSYVKQRFTWNMAKIRRMSMFQGYVSRETLLLV